MSKNTEYPDLHNSRLMFSGLLSGGLGLIVWLLMAGSLIPKETFPLDQKVSISVHPAETLESIIFRLGNNSGQKINYSSLQLLPYKAKTSEYKQAPLGTILEEQLSGTRLTVRIKKRQIWIVPAKQ